MQASRNILVIKTHAIGDVLMATPGIRSLRSLYPQAHITLLVGRWSHPAVRANDNLNECIVVDEQIFFQKQWGALWHLVVELRRKRFDMAVIMHPSPLVHLLAWLAGIPRRLGLERERRSWFLTQGYRENGSADYYYPGNFTGLVSLAGTCDTSLKLDAPVHPDDRKTLCTLAGKKGFNLDAPYLLVAPGGARNPRESIPARLWPREHYRDLLKRIRADYPGLPVVLSGGPGDQELCAWLGENVDGLTDLSAQTSLGELLALVAHAMVVICNDSSVLHMAVAHQRELFAFFGPTSGRTRVPADPRFHVLSKQTPCSPCYHYAVFPGCDHDHVCMRENVPENVYPSVREALSRIAGTAV